MLDNSVADIRLLVDRFLYHLPLYPAILAIAVIDHSKDHYVTTANISMNIYNGDTCLRHSLRHNLGTV